jgi:hypothetical protein
MSRPTITLVNVDGVKPSLFGFHSAVVLSDGTVQATDNEDILKLVSMGFVPREAAPRGEQFIGSLNFAFGSHSGLIAPVFGGAF